MVLTLFLFMKQLDLMDLTIVGIGLMYPTSKGVLGFSSIRNYTVIQNAQFNLLGLMIKDISDVDLDDDGEPLSFDISMEVQKIQPIIGKVVLK